MQTFARSSLCTAVVFLCFSTFISDISVASQRKLRILCTTFPVYLITKNIASNIDSVSVELLLPATLGCPHGSSLTPKDMQKIAKADILITNGLGMEEFLGAPVNKANAQIKIVDSSGGIDGLIKASHRGHSKKRHKHGMNSHEKANPHLFASPKMSALMAVNIYRALANADPENTALFKKNTEAYSYLMNKIADELLQTAGKLRNRNIVVQNDIFDYFARDSGLNIVAVIESHHGHESSAAEIISLIGKIKKGNAGAIFYQPQFSPKTPMKLAKETSIPCDVLDPVATGPEDAGNDYYEKVMRKNIQTLIKALGTVN